MRNEKLILVMNLRFYSLSENKRRNGDFKAHNWADSLICVFMDRQKGFLILTYFAPDLLRYNKIIDKKAQLVVN